MLVILVAFILAGTLYDILVHQNAIIQRMVQTVKEENPKENSYNGAVKTKLNMRDYVPSISGKNIHEVPIIEENVTQIINNEQSEYFSLISHLFLIW